MRYEARMTPVTEPGAWPASPHDTAEQRYPQSYLRERVERSLTAMKAEALDVLLLHLWSRAWNRDPAPLETLKALKEEGKLLSIGISNNEFGAFLKMDGSKLPPILIAMNKAFSAAREGKPSSEIGKASLSRPFPMTNFGDLRYTGFTGGAPVIVGGQVAGAIGISGIDDESEAELSAWAVELIRISLLRAGFRGADLRDARDQRCGDGLRQREAQRAFAHPVRR